MITLDKFVRAYLDAALWTSVDFEDVPRDENYTIGDLSPETIAQAISDCAKFRRKCVNLLEDLDDEQSGHDFWLTRNYHGCGFWGRGLGERGEALTDAAHTFGEYYLCVDEGQICGSR